MTQARAANPGDDRLMLAVLIAAALHMLVIFGITFDALRPGPGRQQIEVTLLQNPTQRSEDATHIAERDQQGSGSEAQRDYASGSDASPPLPRAEQNAARAAASAGRERLSTPAVSSPRGERRIVDRRGNESFSDDLPETERELARLNEKLAELESSLQSQTTPFSTQPRVRRLEAVSARAAADAAYLAQWRRRVEAVGNQYYPQASLRYGIFGRLRLLVTVLSNGDLESVQLLESSGYAILDEAAIRTVQLAAPFPPFPEELRRTTDKLEIVRTWQFEQNALSSG